MEALVYKGFKKGLVSVSSDVGLGISLGLGLIITYYFLELL